MLVLTIYNQMAQFDYEHYASLGALQGCEREALEIAFANFRIFESIWQMICKLRKKFG